MNNLFPDNERFKLNLDSLAKIKRGKNISMEEKRGLRNSIILPTLTFGSETWTWNRVQQSRMCNGRGACGVTVWKDESNERVYKKCSMGTMCKWCEV